jgi:hypothetical protein
VPEAAGSEALACEPGDIAGLADCLRRAARMEDEEYSGRARRCRETLAAELPGPEHYARSYLELAR